VSIDRKVEKGQNVSMKTLDQIPDADEATKAVIECAMTGKPVDPEIARRVRAEGEKLRQQIFEKHGLVDIVVPAIRELRGDLPNP
jgi:hypothetical protein